MKKELTEPIFVQHQTITVTNATAEYIANKITDDRLIMRIFFAQIQDTFVYNAA